MSTDTETNVDQPVEETQAATPPESVTVPADQVVAQEPKVTEQPEESFQVAPEVNSESVPRQVSQPREPDPATVPVSEVSVQTDEVITDTSDPRAVQVPPEGRGDAVTPIARAYADARKVEDVFAEEAAKQSE